MCEIDQPGELRCLLVGPDSQVAPADPTLRLNGQLRGCIGYVLPTKPLYLAVRDMAINSALRDPRFPPVTAEELPDLYIEISVMTLL